jgi:hypothetical protein
MRGEEVGASADNSACCIFCDITARSLKYTKQSTHINRLALTFVGKFCDITLGIYNIYWGTQYLVVKALGYKREGHGFETR